MKKISLLNLIPLLILAIAITNCFAYKSHSPSSRRSICLDNINIDIEDGTLVLANKHDDDEVVEITEDYDLYVNGKKIKTDYRQDALIKDYYNQFMDIIDYAKKIGREGAKIGIEGAKVGLKAAAGVLKLILSDYEADEFEEYIEEEAEELEERADELKEKAEEIEEMAEEFEDLHQELKENIPELQRLDWF
jgi:hypothetical protein